MSDAKEGGRERLPGYPLAALEDLELAAAEQYAAQVENRGPWDAENGGEARWHIWKACDELFQARDHAHAGDYSRALPNFADALNHMLMAMAIAGNESTGTGHE